MGSFARSLPPPGEAASVGMPLPGGARDVGGDDVGGVPVRAAAGSVIPDRGARICVRGGFLHVAQRNPASSAAVMNAWPSVWGVPVLPIPARRATLPTIRPAPCRSSRPGMGLGRERRGRETGAPFAGTALTVRFLEPARVVGELGGGFE